MHRFVVLTSLVFVVGVFHCDGGELRNEWLSHLRRVSPDNFPCGSPQNRTVDVKELVDDATWMEIESFQIMPRRTILQRCFSAGSCKDSYSCKPDVTQEGHLIFGLKDLDSRLTFRNISVENHMSCKCQLEEDIPK